MSPRVSKRSHLLSKSNKTTRLQMKNLRRKGKINKYHNLKNISSFRENKSKISQINNINHIKETSKGAWAKIKRKNQICKESILCAAGSNFKRDFRLLKWTIEAEKQP